MSEYGWARGDAAQISGTTPAEIAQSIRRLIANGAMRPGDPLPPLRQLAEMLTATRNTVAAAYARLSAAGITQVMPNSVIVVGQNAVANAADSDISLMDIGIGNPDRTLLPNPLHALASAPYTPWLYGDLAILPDLAAKITEDYSRELFELGIPTQFRLSLTHGAVDAIERLLTAQLREGDLVAAEDPSFLANRNTIRQFRMRPISVPVDEFGMTPSGLSAALDAGARAVVITPRAQNPYGSTVTADRANELRDVLENHPDVFIIEDDHYWALSTRPYHPIITPDRVRWALVRTVSKHYGPDLRMAFVISDPTTGSMINARLAAGSLGVSHVIQHVVLNLLQQPEAFDVVAKAAEVYQHRAHMLTSLLRSNGIPVPFVPEGLNVWVPLDKSPMQVENELMRRGFLTRRGEMFTVADTPISALRVTSAALDNQLATSFVSTLRDVLDAVPETPEQ